MITIPKQEFSSDDPALAQRVYDALRSYRVPSMRHVRVEVVDGKIVLKGEVHSFYAKQVLQHSARLVAPDSQVIDEVSVVTPAAFRDPLRLRRTATAGVALLLLLLAVGCSQEQAPPVPTFPVTGQVTFGGKPAVGAVVVFHPKSGSTEFPFPHGQADNDGKFQVTTFAKADGAPAGEYVITVELHSFQQQQDDYVLGPNLVPPKYATAATSDLVARVAEGPNEVPINIVR